MMSSFDCDPSPTKNEEDSESHVSAYPVGSAMEQYYNEFKHRIHIEGETDPDFQVSTETTWSEHIPIVSNSFIPSKCLLSFDDQNDEEQVMHPVIESLNNSRGPSANPLFYVFVVIMLVAISINATINNFRAAAAKEEPETTSKVDLEQQSEVLVKIHQFEDKDSKSYDALPPFAKQFVKRMDQPLELKFPAMGNHVVISASILGSSKKMVFFVVLDDAEDVELPDGLADPLYNYILFCLWHL